MKIITAKELDAMCAGIPTVIIADGTYACPTMSWLRNAFWTFFQRFLKEYNVFKYQSYNDCDNFAMLYQVMAQVCHANASASKKPEGIAVGEIHYWMAGAGGHSIIMAITGTPSKLKRTYFEPQNGKQVKLTKAEESSIWFARF